MTLDRLTRLFGHPTLFGIAFDAFLTGMAYAAGRGLVPMAPEQHRLILSIAAGIFVLLLAMLTIVEIAIFVAEWQRDRHNVARPVELMPEIEPSADGSRLYRSVQAPRSAVAGRPNRKELTNR